MVDTCSSAIPEHAECFATVGYSGLGMKVHIVPSVQGQILSLLMEILWLDCEMFIICF